MHAAADPRPLIAIITGTRAEWGLLRPLALLLRHSPHHRLAIVATNMHLMPRYGHTIDEILADGFTVDARVPLPEGDGSPGATLHAMSVALEEMGSALQRLSPAKVVILGDRFEMLAAATAAMMLSIPIAHIAGGETTLGAIDDRIRHSITQMASLHFTQAEPYTRRVIDMGADPAKVFTVGSLGVHNALTVTPMTRAELEASIGFTLGSPTILATFHPATADPGSPTAQQAAMLAALDALRLTHPSLRVILTHPNNDPRSAGLVEALQQWCATRPWTLSIPSLGMRRYLTALRHVSAVVGNSSSGIIEAPSFGVPTVNIGSRQQGRLAAASVIHCAPTAEAILQALRQAIETPPPPSPNPYEGANPPAAILERL